jgi:hypothetical protein
MTVRAINNFGINNENPFSLWDEEATPQEDEGKLFISTISFKTSIALF